MGWQWHMTSDADHICGESSTLVAAAWWVQLVLERSRGVAEAEISGPGWPATRIVAVEGAIRTAQEAGEADAH